jgi:hypothetical protein
MARPKKPAFPADCCGVCRFYRAHDSKDGLCWALPAVPLIDDEGIAWTRAAYAEPDEPACIHFQPRHHA